MFRLAAPRTIHALAVPRRVGSNTQAQTGIPELCVVTRTEPTNFQLPIRRARCVGRWGSGRGLSTIRLVWRGDGLSRGCRRLVKQGSRERRHGRGQIAFGQVARPVGMDGFVEILVRHLALDLLPRIEACWALYHFAAPLGEPPVVGFGLAVR